MDIRLPRDPRWLQIAVLGGLLAYGVAILEFGVSPLRVSLVVGAALGAQAAFSWGFQLARFDPKSALITSFSLSLLLRTPDELTAVGAAVIAIASKFLIRFRNKHVFNPANIAIVLCLMTGSGWVAPGQWGSVALFALALGGCGVFVTARSARADVTFAFLGCYGLLLVGRALWLGDPLSIPLHTLQSGAVVLFAFFMISDPKTTPSARTGRLIFAAFIAATTFAIQFTLYRSDGVMWALALAALFVPVLDHIFNAERYRWPALRSGEHHVAA
ncbi:MAG: RnfABCDGE type electron transport complex subunit D [Myxococcota bacterium]